MLHRRLMTTASVIWFIINSQFDLGRATIWVEWKFLPHRKVPTRIRMFLRFPDVQIFNESERHCNRSL